MIPFVGEAERPPTSPSSIVRILMVLKASDDRDTGEYNKKLSRNFLTYPSLLPHQNYSN